MKKKYKIRIFPDKMSAKHRCLYGCAKGMAGLGQELVFFLVFSCFRVLVFLIHPLGHFKNTKTLKHKNTKKNIYKYCSPVSAFTSAVTCLISCSFDLG